MSALREADPGVGVAPVPMQEEERRRLARFAGLDRPASGQGLWRGVLRPWLSLIPASVLLAWLAQRALLLPSWLESRLLPVLAAYLSASGLAIAGRWLWLRRRRAQWRRRVHGPYLADLDRGDVEEERYAFDACKSWREPERGAVLHLLRIDAERCFAVHDYRDEDYAAFLAGEAPRRLLRPARRAVLRRAPVSRLALSLRFDDDAFATVVEDGPYSDRWPPNRQVWRVPWDEVEQRLMAA
ncbi:hypothetical protein ABU614_13170 [Lysobacter firmicutimachus]|uniref:Uncharacterized protein n=1 Tax=Lysobacter firmicutimachus TaxID=1792846 RepID=A0AAU8MPL5_9GAMM|nr:hypothetical protein [Lysobacter antibioticus]